MTTQLRDYLTIWENQDPLLNETRNVQINNSDIVVSGEYKITLTMSVTVNLPNITSTINESQVFRTFAQSSTDTYTNPEGDLYRIKKFTEKLENDFIEKWNNEVTRMYQEFLPDGFQNG